MRTARPDELAGQFPTNPSLTAKAMQQKRQLNPRAFTNSAVEVLGRSSEGAGSGLLSVPDRRRGAIPVAY